MRPARCSSCGAPILWARTERGSRMPLDRDMVYGGNVDLDARAELARVVQPDPNTRRYTSHFATCPNAPEHRRPRNLGAGGGAYRSRGVRPGED